MAPGKLSFLLFLLGCLNGFVAADQGNYYADDQYQQNDGDDADEDADEGDDATAAAYDDAVAAGDDSTGITYWTDYAILPKRCIVYNDVDVIVFSVYEHAYKQCSDDPMGTYIAPVPEFLGGYLSYYMQLEQDKGYDDYELPDAAQYTTCTLQVIQNQNYYLKMGCTDGTSQGLSVNIYSDNTCTTRSKVNGYDDANIDVSEIQIPFKQCQACVNWIDKNDDEVDDMFYENRQTEAPLCSTAWAYKSDCNRKCQRTGLEPKAKDGWNTPDKILLAILAVFGAGMLVVILTKRQKMSNKDSLLEQAAMSAAGLQQAHVIGIFILVVIIVTVFALLQLKNITWALLLIMNTALFGYLMKLTVDSGVSAGETVIGPDGTIIRHNDSDDSSLESSLPHNAKKSNAGTYMLPTIA